MNGPRFTGMTMIIAAAIVDISGGSGGVIALRSPTAAV
jgi:hypothetical protein